MAFPWRHVMRFSVKNGRTFERSQITQYWSKLQTKSAKRREIELSTRWLLGRLKFESFDHEISQKLFWGKNCSKIQNFGNLKNNSYMYKTHRWVLAMPNYKSVPQFFDLQMAVINLGCDDVTKFDRFFSFIDIVRKKKQFAPLDSWDVIESEKCVFCSTFWNSTFDLCWPLWPDH